MDVFDFVASRKVLVSNVAEPSASSASSPVRSGPVGSVLPRDYEVRWKELKRVIRAENAKKRPCSDTLKSATAELRQLRRLLKREDGSPSGRRTVVSCLENTAPASTTSAVADWSESPRLRRRNSQRKRFVFYMPAGKDLGTDVTIGRERLEKLQERANRSAYGPLQNVPTVSIAGVPQPMDRFNSRRRR